MEELALHQPELIGREEELSKLKQSLDNAITGKGSTIFISGEAGIGKTRLVSELITEAEFKGVQIIQGWCLAESLEPLMPIKSALREAGLFHLISGDPPPLVVSAYLMNDAGLLIAKAEKEESELDPQIFASMLNAVGNFVKDSMQMIDQVEQSGGLNILGYKDFKILIEEYKGLYLASVSKGSLSEFLVNDMKEVLSKVENRFGSVLASWDGDLDNVKGIDSIVAKLVTSGKYAGKFLVDDPKLKQENLFDNILLGIQRASQEKLVLLFLDDLQWSDPTSLNLIHYLSRNTKENKVFLLGTYRPEDIVESHDGKTHQLETAMQGMNREDLLDKIELNRLGAEDTEKIITSALGKVAFNNKFYEKIYHETEGTPFFVLEVVKLLVEDKAIAQDDQGIWQQAKDLDEIDIPSKVYDVVKRRLDRLMKEQRRILDCASVVGEEFQSDVVGKVMGYDRIPLLENLSDIEKTHKLVHSFQKKYVFDHSKVREVLYNGIIDELKQEYHKIVADTIAELHKDNLDEVISDLAHHYFKAGDERAGEYLVRAGDRAKEEYANEESIRLYNNALTLLKDDKELKHVHENLGDVYSLTGEFDKAIENYNPAMEKEKNNKKKADLHRKIAQVHNKKGDFEKSREECSNGLELLSGEECTEAVGLLSAQGWTHMRTGDYDRAGEILERGLNTAEKLGDKNEVAQFLHDIGTLSWYQDDYDDALKNFENALEIREVIEDALGLAKSLNNIGIVYHNKGELVKALGFYERSLTIKEKIGDKRGIASSLSNIGSMYKSKGEVKKALEFHERSLEIREKIGDKSGIALSLGKIGVMYHNKGELGRALEYYEQSLEIAEKIGDKSGIASVLTAMGIVYTNWGELDRALDYYEQSLDICIEIGEKRLSIYNYYGLAEVYLEFGKIQFALENAEKAVEIAVEIGAKAEEGMSRRVLGMVHRENGEWDKATEEFEKAREILEEVGDKNELARLSYECGLMWKAKGESDKAKEHLEKALSMFEEMGMKLWEEKCRKALADL